MSTTSRFPSPRAAAITVINATKATLVARPSMLSMMLNALVTPTTQRTVTGRESQPSEMVASGSRFRT
jgi:hypothetical protein